ncbi:PREDICTED: uncharacterized protein LOC109581295 [Amphimedon queenslandica]|uniref:AIG1-type G domain-containing protein n=1 Tax=Amphimedon queenslandica TaxID=400682 RepID=A0AAN0J2A2_AMPQE|nr:PREDICTED: uncharacterized protein LOC109581295 [Amphimedon queenslandica]|eukprot:XP_019850858.1 PREDICTED: uncharacterized protein LOC109581295 [Amphimedon queenslandica]
MATQLVDPLEDITSPSEIPTQENVADVPLDDKFGKKSAKLKRKKHHVKILVMGLTVSQAGANPVQKETQYYKGEHDGIKIKVYDAPGFGDEGLSDQQILEDIFSSKNARKKGYDLILIALRMDNRFDLNTDMLSSLKQYMDRGNKWERTIMVLTFANSLLDQLENNPQQYTEEQMKIELQVQKEQFQKRFQKHTGKDDVPFVLAGKAIKRKLPTDDDWLVTLWEQSILRCRTKAKPFVKRLGIFRLLNQLRLKLRSIFFTTEEESADFNGPDGLEEGSNSEGEDEESSSSEEEGGSFDDGSLQHVEMDLVQEVNAALLPEH